ncbi:DNRLRE domain-containing protein [Luteolibacter flavescens]|uniref:DNRLRE domain-containing protein n=1 Tax=Luteolibacter flavescens TaxID=1859460 RepID=A0ABT3FLB9_9BACT|nr:DNRLRE domain-containing protein [Luteolibacter flavescens]MCW1884353.1 DNRLRE domain-containing protein [Luteolibacter flavescens]
MLACTLAATAETVTLNSTKASDIYSYSDKPTSTTATLGINSSGPGSPHSQRTLIEFNLTGLSIPAAEIGSAKLRLFVIPPNPAYGDFVPGNAEVFRQTAAWTWTLQNPSLRWNDFKAGESYGLLAVPAGSEGFWREIDVTPLVVSWASGAHPNYGFALQSESETKSFNVSFASTIVNGYAPQLAITRAVAPAVPPVLTIATSGASSMVLHWPVAGSTGWVLQTSETLAGPWTAVTGATQSAGTWQVTTPRNSSGRGFFRLSKP